MGERWGQVLAGVALAGPLVFIGAFVLLNVLQPAFTGRDSLSAYALGEFGWLMNVAFVAAGTGFVALAGVLSRGVEPSRWKTVGVTLLVVAGVGWVLLGAANTHNAPGPTTLPGWTHAVGFTLGFPALILAPVVWGRAFTRDSRWRSMARWSTLAALIVVVAFLLTPLTGGASFLAAVVLLMAWAGWAARLASAEPHQ